MELVVGCYEQVFFGFVVYLEFKVSEDYEVRVGVWRDYLRGVVEGQVWFLFGLGKYIIRGEYIVWDFRD